MVSIYKTVFTFANLGQDEYSLVYYVFMELLLPVYDRFVINKSLLVSQWFL